MAKSARQSGLRAISRNCLEHGLALYGRVARSFAPVDFILCYHNVRDDRSAAGAGGDGGYLSANRALPVSLFEEQLDWLASWVDFVSLDEIANPDPQSKRSRVAITFDDGYRNNVELAFPRLAARNIPVTWFVSTGFVRDPDSLPWWDLLDYIDEFVSQPITMGDGATKENFDLRDPAIKRQFLRHSRAQLFTADLATMMFIVTQLRESIEEQQTLPKNAFCRPEEVAQAATIAGLRVGAHTEWHPNLAACTITAATEELRSGVANLERWSGQTPNWLAYPFGTRSHWSQDTIEVAQEMGFTGALTTVPGTIRTDSGRFALPRIQVTPNQGMSAFKARTHGAELHSVASNFAHSLRRS